MALTLEIGGSDLTANLARDSLWINDSVADRVATFTFTLEDVTAALALTERDEVHLYDSGYSQTYFHGTVGGLDTIQHDPANASALAYTVHCQDDSYELERRVVTTACFAAGSSSDLDRVSNLFDRFYASGIDYSTHVTSTSLMSPMEEQNFVGTTLRAALAQICGQSGGMFYVHYDYTTGSPFFHYFDPLTGEENDAAYSLSNVAANIGGSVVGYLDITERRDAYQLTNTFYITGTNVSGCVVDATSESAYGAAQAPYQDSNILTACALNATGSALLSKYKDPEIVYYVRTRTGSGLRAGMRIDLEWSTRSISGCTYEIRNIRTVLVNDEPEYTLELGSIPSEFGSQGRTIADQIANVERVTLEVVNDIYDTTEPSQPTFTGANMSTGTTLDADGHQIVYVQMTWGSVSDADLDHYDVELSTASAFDTFGMSRTHPASGSRIERFEGVTGNTVHYGRVRSVDWVGNYSAWASGSITSATDSTAPDQIVGMVVAGARTLLGVTWTAASESDFAHYEIQRANNNSGSPDSFATVNTARLSSYIDQDFTEAQIQTACTFWYQVKAVDTSGNSGSYSTPGSAALNPLGSDSIAACAIIAGKIAASTIDANHISSSTIVADHISASQITADKVSIATLSAISASMGILTAGEIRVGSGTVGSNFTGFRIMETYIAGYNNDAPQFYISASNGRAYWSTGCGILDEDGIRLSMSGSYLDYLSYGFVSGGSVIAGLRGKDEGGPQLYLTACAPSGSGASIDVWALASASKYSDVYIGAFSGVNGATIRLTAQNVLGVDSQFITVITENFRISQVGKTLINDSANANSTIGITINQGANDDEILTLKSSDVAHGATGLSETDTYGFMRKVEGTAGGLDLWGFKDSGGIAGLALRVRGFLAENADTTKSTSGRGIIEIMGNETSGSTTSDTVANGNVVVFRTQRGGADVSLAILDEDGDWSVDGSNTATYDTEDDALMAWDLSRAMAGEYGEIIRYHRPALEAAGIIGPTDDQGHFLMSTKRVRMLLLCSVGQLYERLKDLETKLLPEGG